jgi:hypothetical protein
MIFRLFVRNNHAAARLRDDMLRITTRRTLMYFALLAGLG